ncbi:carboxypeptidase-like regulatory domain-containing protein [Clostridium sp. BNL1100]|uniref:carboxypeptidase-like regulatory domain-containing protein n=1 Tax=Clostridium sp. BNL1100 TaxID=755731 RepID=UPI00024A727E|nr:carboxypeptidase-like regulatory domain-containing protein [Clostridium sp. BNL1100]AEY65919.1 hypothetical protein Clo1100_1708 [Clostridium sp. BNL1100]
MEFKDQTLQEEEGKVKKKNKISLEKDSIQYNAQDLDQEQKMDVNPTQLNSQNIRLYLSRGENNNSGKITGTAYIKESKEVVKNAGINLFLGHDRRYPVYKTNSDENGNFIIDDIPPGFYTIVAKYDSNLKYESHYIKIFGGQVVHQSILLE